MKTVNKFVNLDEMHNFLEKQKSLTKRIQEDTKQESLTKWIQEDTKLY